MATSAKKINKTQSKVVDKDSKKIPQERHKQNDSRDNPTEFYRSDEYVRVAEEPDDLDRDQRISDKKEAESDRSYQQNTSDRQANYFKQGVGGDQPKQTTNLDNYGFRYDSKDERGMSNSKEDSKNPKVKDKLKSSSKLKKV